MEGDQAKLTPRRRLLPVLSVAIAVALLSACSDGDDAASDDTVVVAPTAPADAPDPDAFCEQLTDLVADDPFDAIFGNDNPMQAAAAFDGGEVTLDALVAVAPDDIQGAAERYREAFLGWRGLILPSTTIDQADFDTESEQLRAERDAARAELDAYLIDACESR